MPSFDAFRLHGFEPRTSWFEAHWALTTTYVRPQLLSLQQRFFRHALERFNRSNLEQMATVLLNHYFFLLYWLLDYRRLLFDYRRFLFDYRHRWSFCAYFFTHFANRGCRRLFNRC